MTELTQSSAEVVFPYATLRNISSPQDERLGRKIYSGQAPCTSFLGLSTEENVRAYLLDAKGKKRRQPTQVHRAMVDTLERNAEDFSVLNGGVVIVAKESVNDDRKKHLTLVEPSIINGSQTQGVLRDFLEAVEQSDEEAPEVYVKYELIITDSDELIANTSIARNFQNDVMAVSILGKLDLLNELEERIQTARPELKLRKSETDWARRLADDEEFVYTEKLIQVITALVPPQLWMKGSERDNPNKVYTYSQKTKCLRDFQRVVEEARSEEYTDEVEHDRAVKLYQFFLDVAVQAMDLYAKWKEHQGFVGHRLRNWSRTEDGRKIVEVPDGMIFPILGALSAFAVETDEGWRIQPPEAFDEDELIRSAVTTYREVADSNPSTMGKSKACYSSLYQLTSLYRRLTAATA